MSCTVVNTGSCLDFPIVLTLYYIRKSNLNLHPITCLWTGTPGGGVLPYMGYIGMCGPKGYGFSAVLVINRVSILADFGHFGHK